METQVELAVVPAVLNSLMLLNRTNLRGVSSWVPRTVQALSIAAHHRNRVVGSGLMAALVPDQTWASFPDYLDDLATTEPVALRDRLVRRVGHLAATRSNETYPAAAILADWRVYIKALKAAQPGEALEVTLAHETHGLLHNPTALHDLVISHLREMWDGWLAAEWTRVAPTLHQSADRIRGQMASGRPVLAALQQVAGRDSSDWAVLGAGTTRTVVVPSPHNGVLTTFLRGDTTLWVCVGRDLFNAELVRSTPVGRGELLNRLQALADDARLWMMELLHERGELSAQDIIAQTGFSQSSASRDLNSLRNAGFVHERRVGGANKFYRLAPNHIASTFEALNQLLAGEMPMPVPAAAHNNAQPAALSRCLNADGHMVIWPSKQQDRLLVLAYLIEQFEPGHFYTEKQVNDILCPHTGSDVAHLRRTLFSNDLLNREGDGSRYWRV